MRRAGPAADASSSSASRVSSVFCFCVSGWSPSGVYPASGARPKSGASSGTVSAGSRPSAARRRQLLHLDARVSLEVEAKAPRQHAGNRVQRGAAIVRRAVADALVVDLVFDPLPKDAQQA
jgi:hypothetical protein